MAEHPSTDALLDGSGYLLTFIRTDIKQPFDRFELARKLLSLRSGRVRRRKQNERRYIVNGTTIHQQWGMFDLLLVSKGPGFPRDTHQTIITTIGRRSSQIQSYSQTFLYRFRNIGCDPLSVNLADYPILYVSSLSVTASVIDEFGTNALVMAAEHIQRSVEEWNGSSSSSNTTDQMRKKGNRPRKPSPLPFEFSVLGDLGSADLYLLLYTQSIDDAYRFLRHKIRPIQISKPQVPLFNCSFSNICFIPDLIERKTNIKKQSFNPTLNLAVEPGAEASVANRIASIFASKIRRGSLVFRYLSGEYDLQVSFTLPPEQPLELGEFLDFRSHLAQTPGVREGLRSLYTDYQLDLDIDSSPSFVRQQENMGGNSQSRIPAIRSPSIASKDLKKFPSFFASAIQSIFTTYESLLADPLLWSSAISMHQFLTALSDMLRDANWKEKGLSVREQSAFLSRVVGVCGEAFKTVVQGEAPLRGSAHRGITDLPVTLRTSHSKLIDACYSIQHAAWTYATSHLLGISRKHTSRDFCPLILQTAEPETNFHDFRNGLTVTHVSVFSLFQFSDLYKLVHEIGHKVFRDLMTLDDAGASSVGHKITTGLAESLTLLVAHNLAGALCCERSQLIDLAKSAVETNISAIEIRYGFWDVQSYTKYVDAIIDFLIAESSLGRILAILPYAGDLRGQGVSYSKAKFHILRACRTAAVRSLYSDAERLRKQTQEILADYFMVLALGLNFQQYLSVLSMDLEVYSGYRTGAEHTEGMANGLGLRPAALHFLVGRDERDTLALGRWQNDYRLSGRLQHESDLGLLKPFLSQLKEALSPTATGPEEEPVLKELSSLVPLFAQRLELMKRRRRLAGQQFASHRERSRTLQQTMRDENAFRQRSHSLELGVLLFCYETRRKQYRASFVESRVHPKAAGREREVQ